VIHYGNVIGKVTAIVYSLQSGRSLAMVQIDPSLATPGNDVEIKGESGSWKATTAAMPLLDPDKSKRAGGK
jgi:glycine cleavage system aminomethyltransferase T